jgi:hypothetical protein
MSGVTRSKADVMRLRDVSDVLDDLSASWTIDVAVGGAIKGDAGIPEISLLMDTRRHAKIDANDRLRKLGTANDTSLD